VLLASQKVVPKRLLEAGFQFEHPDLKAALETILQGAGGEPGRAEGG
jgi:NAD dependent epimerase/dehydratase family enzyme